MMTTLEGTQFNAEDGEGDTQLLYRHGLQMNGQGNTLREVGDLQFVILNDPTASCSRCASSNLNTYPGS